MHAETFSGRQTGAAVRLSWKNGQNLLERGADVSKDKSGKTFQEHIWKNGTVAK